MIFVTFNQITTVSVEIIINILIGLCIGDIHFRTVLSQSKTTFVPGVFACANRFGGRSEAKLAIVFTSECLIGLSIGPCISPQSVHLVVCLLVNPSVQHGVIRQSIHNSILHFFSPSSYPLELRFPKTFGQFCLLLVYINSYRVVPMVNLYYVDHYPSSNIENK